MNSVKKVARRHKKVIFVVAAIVVTVLVVSCLAISWLSGHDYCFFQNIGTIRTIGVKVYWDQDLQNETKEAEWGPIYAGYSESVIVYVQSQSNVETTLELVPFNWAFFNSDDEMAFGPVNTTSYMTFTWNCSNTVVRPGSIIPAKLTLVSDNSPETLSFIINNDITRFSFDAVIRPKE